MHWTGAMIGSAAVRILWELYDPGNLGRKEDTGTGSETATACGREDEVAIPWRASPFSCILLIHFPSNLNFMCILCR